MVSSVFQGLDPTGPLFEFPSAARTMRWTDLEFVDCYHTNKGVLGIDHNLIMTLDMLIFGSIMVVPFNQDVCRILVVILKGAINSQVVI